MLHLGTKLSYLVGVTNELCKYVLMVNSTDASEEYKFWSILIERKVILRFMNTDLDKKDAVKKVEISQIDFTDKNDCSNAT